MRHTKLKDKFYFISSLPQNDEEFYFLFELKICVNESWYVFYTPHLPLVACWVFNSRELIICLSRKEEIRNRCYVGCNRWFSFYFFFLQNTNPLDFFVLTHQWLLLLPQPVEEKKYFLPRFFISLQNLEEKKTVHPKIPAWNNLVY